MIKYRQLCFWIAVTTASTAFAQTPPAKPESVAVAKGQKVTQEVTSDTQTDSTTPKNSQPKPAKSEASPATAATPANAANSVPATTAAEAAQPRAESGRGPTPESGGNQVAAPENVRRTTSRVAIIELGDQSSTSDVIRQVVEALEKQGVAKQTEPADSDTQQESGLTARIAARSDTKVEDVLSLVRSLQGHNVQRMSFTKPTNDRNVVTVLAPADTPWPVIDNIRMMVTAKKQFAVEVQIATPTPRKYTTGSRSRYGYSVATRTGGASSGDSVGGPAKRASGNRSREGDDYSSARVQNKPQGQTGKKETTRTAVILRGEDGEPVPRIEKSSDAIEKALKETDRITVMTGRRNVLLPLLAAADVSKVARAILGAINGDDEVRLLAGDDGLWVQIPQKDFANPNLGESGEVVKAILQAQSGGKVGGPTLPVDANTGTDTNPTTESKTIRVSETRIFMLQHADAKVMAQTLSELFSEGFGIAPDVNINAIIVRGDASQLKEVEAIVKLVDGENGKKPAVEGRIPRFKTTISDSASPNQKQTLTVDVDVPLVPAATVRSQIADLDVRIKETANSLRSTKSTPDQKAEYNAKRKAELRDVVRKTFLARQELQRAELAEFAARLDRIKRSIEMRDRIADQIIDRRVDELLEPNVKWDHDASAGVQKKVVRNQSVIKQQNQGQRLQPVLKQDAVAVAERPVAVAPPSNGTVILRKADEFRELLTTHAKRVAQTQASNETWKQRYGESNENLEKDEAVKREEEARGRAENLARVEADRNFAVKEYRTQIQLLESEVETVHLVVETAKQALARTESLVKAKAAPSHELNERKRELAAAIQRLERARVLLDLYLDAGEGI